MAMRGYVEGPPSPFIACLILHDNVFNDKQRNMKHVKATIRAADEWFRIQVNIENPDRCVVRLRPRVLESGVDAVSTLLREIPQLLARVHRRIRR
ncbi:unnamed protein product [Phytomonas sp. EM1]|nr:unnamed protein product [Phytomonas sp. EM1]|eukprot:CCW65527.1 unnamed protein product [Phytomonas sp. isolate EM1]